MTCIKDSLKQNPRVQEKKNNKTRQAGVYPSPGESGFRPMQWLPGKTNAITLNIPSSSFLQVLLLSTMSYEMGHLFGQLASAMPGVSPPWAPPIWSLAEQRKTQQPLMLCERRSAATET